MDAVKVGFGDSVNETGAVFREHASLLLLTMLGIALGFSAIDALGATRAQAVPNLIVSIYVQFKIVERLLANRIPSGLRQHRYGAIFLSGLLATLGTLAGLVLLIVPGLLLMAGWSISTPFIVVNEMSGTEALGASWRATAGARLSLMLVFLVFGILLIVSLVGLYLLIGGTEGSDAPTQIGEIVYTNVLTAIMVVSGWVVGAAVYRLVVPAHNQLQEVFK